jgi:hypothetical protein
MAKGTITKRFCYDGNGHSLLKITEHTYWCEKCGSVFLVRKDNNSKLYKVKKIKSPNVWK